MYMHVPYTHVHAQCIEGALSGVDKGTCISVQVGILYTCRRHLSCLEHCDISLEALK